MPRVKTIKNKKKVVKNEAAESEKVVEATKIETVKAETKSAEQEKEEIRSRKVRKYFEAVGRRKESTARVRLFTAKPFEEDEGRITVSGKFYKQYFPTIELQQIAEASLRRLKSLGRFEVEVQVKGGGIRGQAEALRHGLARTLVLFNADFRKKLKKAGYLKRDPRVKERRKYGLKKARRAPQWSKR
jgi:small subunit ribosomal protein S9